MKSGVLWEPRVAVNPVGEGGGRGAGEECGSQRNCCWAWIWSRFALTPKKKSSFTRLWPCTSVPNSGASGINWPMSWVALYIISNSFLWDNLAQGDIHPSLYIHMLQRSGFYEILSPEKSKGEYVLASEKTAKVIKDRERQYLVLDLLWLGGEWQYNLEVTKKIEVKMEGD